MPIRCILRYFRYGSFQWNPVTKHLKVDEKKRVTLVWETRAKFLPLVHKHHGDNLKPNHPVCVN